MKIDQELKAIHLICSGCGRQLTDTDVKRKACYWCGTDKYALSSTTAAISEAVEHVKKGK